MTTLKIKFRPSSLKDKEGTVYYQIIHNRHMKQFATDFHIFPEEWDDKTIIKPSIKTNIKRIVLLESYRSRISIDKERIYKIINGFENSASPFSADDIVNSFREYISGFSFFNYAENLIIRKKSAGKERTAETYGSALSSFKKFRENEDILIEAIDCRLIEEYQRYLIERKVSFNTISFYMRNLRSIYNQAVEEGQLSLKYPFRNVFTGIEKTVKRAIPLDIIRRLKKLDLSHYPHLDYARDMFMLAFYLRGISFVDMAFLQKTNLKQGRLTYVRRKTGKKMEIKWTPEMQEILDKYEKNSTSFLFPIITSAEGNERAIYRNKALIVNNNLKVIGRILNLSMPLTHYVARHSWATAARNKGIPIEIISEGMGHNSENTTRIYLASIDTSKVDNANSLILESLK